MDLHGATFYHLSILSFLNNIYTALSKLTIKFLVEPIKLIVSTTNFKKEKIYHETIYRDFINKH